jgi:hypothetical protein
MARQAARLITNRLTDTETRIGQLLRKKEEEDDLMLARFRVTTAFIFAQQYSFPCLFGLSLSLFFFSLYLFLFLSPDGPNSPPLPLSLFLHPSCSVQPNVHALEERVE